MSVELSQKQPITDILVVAEGVALSICNRLGKTRTEKDCNTRKESQIPDIK